jgi:hypothetical protein
MTMPDQIFPNQGLSGANHPLLADIDGIMDETVLLNMIAELEREIEKIESITGKSRRTHFFNLEIIRMEKRLCDINPVWSSLR